MLTKFESKSARVKGLTLSFIPDAVTIPNSNLFPSYVVDSTDPYGSN